MSYSLLSLCGTRAHTQGLRNARCWRHTSKKPAAEVSCHRGQWVALHDWTGCLASCQPAPPSGTAFSPPPPNRDRASPHPSSNETSSGDSTRLSTSPNRHARCGAELHILNRLDHSCRPRANFKSFHNPSEPSWFTTQLSSPHPALCSARNQPMIQESVCRLTCSQATRDCTLPSAFLQTGTSTRWPPPVSL